MPEIHPTAALEGEIELADDVVVGAGCVLTGPMTIGAGTRLIGNVYLQGPLRLGTGNVVYPFSCLGFAPQHIRFDPREPGLGLEIGDGNTFREHATVHRAFETGGPTRIGHGNYFMVGAHVGHDARVGDQCTFVNGTMLGGHVVVGDRVLIGGATGVHQFCHIGDLAMLTGGVALTRDLPPYFTMTGYNVCGSINLVGLRRAGFSSDEIRTVKWAHRTICRSNATRPQIIEALNGRQDDPIVQRYLAFIAQSTRGLCPGVGSRLRTGVIRD